MRRMTDASTIVAEDLESVEIPPAERRRLASAAVAAIRVAFLGTTLEVAFDDARAAARYASRYARFRSDALVDERAFAVRDGDATYFWYRDRPAYRWPAADLGPVALDFLTDSVIRREFFGSRAGALTFHAAAVDVGGRAVAIVAPSTGGKTTTAIACARRGLRLFTDEECVLVEGRVQPFPRAINLRADGIERVLADPDFDDGGLRERLAAHRGAAWLCASYDDLFGATPLPQPAPLAAFYFIRPGGPPASIAPLSRAEALTLFFAAWPRSDRSGIDRVADVVRLFAVAPPFALRLGTPDETALAIRDAGRETRATS